MSSLFGACIIISSLSLSLANIPPKEHKVHNIVLYPDKHSWCKLTPIKQVISHIGCQSKSVDNKICVGTCFSFSVPKTIPETPGDDQLHYCDSCQASESTWITVSLDCPDDHTLDKVEKSVEIISNCSCMFCKEKPRHIPRPEEDDYTEYEDEIGENFKQAYDLRQLAIKHAAIRNHNSANSATPKDRVISQKHLDLLKGDPIDDTDSEGVLAVPVWNTFRAVLKRFFKIL